MVTLKSLSIAGYQGREVRNTFVSQGQGTKHLAVVFPGLNYTIAMPVLFYPGRLLAEMGADVLLVDTTYDRMPEYERGSDEEKQRWREADADAALNAALAQGKYDQVTLVGKSIGTLVVGHLLQSHPNLPGISCVWLTPLIKAAELRAVMAACPHRALFVIGTADSHYAAVLLDEVREATGGDALVIEGANHSLEIAGSVVKSVEVMRQVVEKLEAFLKT